MRGATASAAALDCDKTGASAPVCLQSEKCQVLDLVHYLVERRLGRCGIATRHEHLPEFSVGNVQMQDGNAHAAAIAGDLGLGIHHIGEAVRLQRIGNNAFELADVCQGLAELHAAKIEEEECHVAPPV